jgi:thiamine-phosphate pyrophosphorylase
MQQLPTFQYITHPNENFEDFSWVNNLYEGGIRWIQLRIKENHFLARNPQKNHKEFFIEKGKELAKICADKNILFTINDHVEWVNEIGANGAHIGKEDISISAAKKQLSSDAILGVTANNFEDILQLKNEQIDYIGLGPLRDTTTKDKEKLAPTLGLAGYEKIIRQMNPTIATPIFAIGGITEKDTVPLMEIGIYGIALSGYIFQAKHDIDLIKRTIKTN